MVCAEEIRDAIKTILISGDPKNSKGKKIKKWLDGEPSRFPNFPCGFIQWAGGPVTPSAAKSRIVDNFYIVVVDRYPDTKKAENSILSFYEAIKNILKTNPTLNGKVATSYPVNREIDRFFKGDYSNVALRITFYTRRRE